MMADYNGAIQAFTDAIEYDPTAYEAYFERGSAYFNKRNFKKSSRRFSAGCGAKARLFECLVQPGTDNGNRVGSGNGLLLL